MWKVAKNMAQSMVDEIHAKVSQNPVVQPGYMKYGRFSVNVLRQRMGGNTVRVTFVIEIDNDPNEYGEYEEIVEVKRRTQRPIPTDKLHFFANEVMEAIYRRTGCENIEYQAGKYTGWLDIYEVDDLAHPSEARY